MNMETKLGSMSKVSSQISSFWTKTTWSWRRGVEEDQVRAHVVTERSSQQALNLGPVGDTLLHRQPVLYPTFRTFILPT